MSLFEYVALKRFKTYLAVGDTIAFSQQAGN